MSRQYFLFWVHALEKWDLMNIMLMPSLLKMLQRFSRLPSLFPDSRVKFWYFWSRKYFPEEKALVITFLIDAILLLAKEVKLKILRSSFCMGESTNEFVKSVMRYFFLRRI